MRLTLRTLLSWRDGMLDPEAAGDLAARVEASAHARTLAARIDEVVARPTLSAPAPDAAGFAAAANTTAEYLDNVLPADQLGEFERVCFASEAQLAETAGVHGILAELARAPAAPLDGATSRRLLAAVRARSDAGEPPGPPPEAVQRPSRSQADGPVPLAPKRPARTPTSAWLLVGAAGLLLATLVGVLGWSVTKAGRGRGGRATATRMGAAAAPDAPGRAPGPPPAGHVATPAVPVASAVPEAAEPSSPAEVVPADGGSPPLTAVVESPVASAGATPVPGVSASSASPPQVAALEQRVPQGDALAIAAPPVPEAAASVAESVAPAAPAVIVSGSDVVLFRSAEDRATAWRAGVEATPLELPVDVVAPPFCRPTLVVDDMRIALEPGTRGVLRRGENGAPHLEVVFGAAVIAGPGPLGLVAGGLAGAIATGPAAPVGVEVELRRPPGAGADATRRAARIVPSAGRIAWQPAAAGAGTWEVAAGQALEWHGDAGGDTALRDAGPPPTWVVGIRDDAALERRAASALAARLGTGGDAVPALRELAAHRRIENRMAAAAALALVGEFDDLARLLVASDAAALPESLWSRLDTVAVQPALARGARAAESFAAAVAAHAPAGAADQAIRFARGIGADDLAAGADADLVAALESPHLVVRRYAIRNLLEIVAPAGVDRLRYRADRPPEALREGAAWWRTQCERGRVRRAATEGGGDR